MNAPRHVVATKLPTQHGEFDVHTFEWDSGQVYLTLVMGEVDVGGSVLTRLHSECLTGDALGSLRCDCGEQLRLALRRIAAEGRGVLVYLTGHEGRGIGLVNKLRAYLEQDKGADTVEANLQLGLPVDARQYVEAAAVLLALGVRTVRLLTNNPEKVKGLTGAGVEVEGLEPIVTAAHNRNLRYLQTKERRLGHMRPAGAPLDAGAPVQEVSRLLGPIRPTADRPFVVLKYAQTMDGRIATANGDSKWISGEAERSISHSLRAACDAVMVGIGTVLHDDPQLTVRLVPGNSPLRVVLDSRLRLPLSARLLDDDASTLVLTTDRSSATRLAAVRSRGAGVRLLPAGPGGVDVAAALRLLREQGVHSLLVEGGAKVITGLLAGGFADRVIVGLAPKIVGAGTEAVGDLGVRSVRDGIRLANRSLHVLADDVLLAWDVQRDGEPVSPGRSRRAVPQQPPAPLQH